MARGPSKPEAQQPRKMTLAEIRAFNDRLMASPEIQEMLRAANDPANANDVVRWEDLKRKHAGR